MMKAKDFAAKAKDIAQNYKTLYVLGAFGCPLNATNKKRYIEAYSYNKQREAMINSASADTFGFDCGGLIKGILWGWSGDTNAVYGGAVYCKDGIPDFNESVINDCTDVSSDFSKIAVGEVLYKTGHIGIYIGDGLGVECTPAWKNKVQITAVSALGAKKGYNTRVWQKHGKLPYVDYTADVLPNTSKRHIINGYNCTRGIDQLIIYTSARGSSTGTNQWGSEAVCDSNGICVQKPSYAGNHPILLGGFTVSGHGNASNWVLENIKVGTKCTIDGDYLYVSGGSNLKSNEEIAKEVIAGKWGVGAVRKSMLKKAGYDYATIQGIVNKLMKG